MIEFAFIAPKSVQEQAMAASDCHMALAHLCGDPFYTEPFANSNQTVYLDNSYFELGYSLDTEAMLKAAEAVRADVIILSDGTLADIEVYQAQGYQVMAIPSGPNMEDQFLAALYNKAIDYVGLSFTHASRAMGTSRNDPSARFRFLQSLGCMLPNKKIHMLGMTDSVFEVSLVKPYHFAIASWDSSAAVWNGVQGIRVDQMLGKNLKPVDFDAKVEWVEICNMNIKTIKEQAK